MCRELAEKLKLLLGGTANTRLNSCSRRVHMMSLGEWGQARSSNQAQRAHVSAYLYLGGMSISIHCHVITPSANMPVEPWSKLSERWWSGFGFDDAAGLRLP